jgi:PhnB protein
MNTGNRYIRHGFGAVRPYLYGGLDLPDFVQEVFGAVELERHALRQAKAYRTSNTGGIDHA